MDQLLKLLVILASPWLCACVVIEQNEAFVKETKICHGTDVGFGYSGSEEYHFEALRTRYTGCTHVDGNLEITNLVNTDDVTYDLSFLSEIEVVTGYVLIGLLNIETIPLLQLKLIRADRTFEIKGEDYGLVVVGTAYAEIDDSETGNENENDETSTKKPTKDLKGLVELQIPKLQEISRGKVLFFDNPKLKHVQTINWQEIVPALQDPVVFEGDEYQQDQNECDQICEYEGTRSCWGKSRYMCQKHTHASTCDPSCPSRCYDGTVFGCCHPECAIGCFGPTEKDCIMCKYFQHKDECISMCPDGHARHGQACLEHDLHHED